MIPFAETGLILTVIYFTHANINALAEEQDGAQILDIWNEYLLSTGHMEGSIHSEDSNQGIPKKPMNSCDACR